MLGTKEESYNMMCHKDISAKHVTTIMRTSQNCWDFLHRMSSLMRRHQASRCLQGEDVYLWKFDVHICQFLWVANSRDGHFLLENSYFLPTTHSLSVVFLTPSSIFCHSHQLLSISWKSFGRMTQKWSRELWELWCNFHHSDHQIRVSFH